MAQRSRLVDNQGDDADKYDFADNYQQTDDDVTADQLADNQYVQESNRRFFKDSDDIYEEPEQVQQTAETEVSADEYD